MTDHSRETFGIDFIDPFFAVAIHIGFTHGVLEEAWFKDWHIPTGHEVFDFWVLALGFCTVILSWVGYHESIKTKPLKNAWRFILDVLLVGSYALLLVKFRDIDAVLQLTVWIYLLFVVWDVFKVREYKEAYEATRSPKRYWRELVTVGAFFVFCGLLLARCGLHLSPTVTLIAMWVATIVYRLIKGIPGTTWQRLWLGVARANV